MSGKPVVSVKPVVSGKPVVSVKPVVSGKPVVPVKSVVSGKPDPSWIDHPIATPWLLRS